MLRNLHIKEINKKATLHRNYQTKQKIQITRVDAIKLHISKKENKTHKTIYMKNKDTPCSEVRTIRCYMSREEEEKILGQNSST